MWGVWRVDGRQPWRRAMPEHMRACASRHRASDFAWMHARDFYACEGLRIKACEGLRVEACEGQHAGRARRRLPAGVQGLPPRASSEGMHAACSQGHPALVVLVVSGIRCGHGVLVTPGSGGPWAPLSIRLSFIIQEAGSHPPRSRSLRVGVHRAFEACRTSLQTGCARSCAHSK